MHSLTFFLIFFYVLNLCIIVLVLVLMFVVPFQLRVKICPRQQLLRLAPAQLVAD